MDRNKLKLTFLLLAAAIPITLASLYFEIREDGEIQSTTNRGRLIVPVMDITEFGLQTENGEGIFQSFETMVADIELDDYEPRPWVLMYLGNENCDNTCEQRLFSLKQMHIRLSSESDRVERYYVNASAQKYPLNNATVALFEDRFADMKIAESNSGLLLESLNRTTNEGVNPIEEHYIYLVDPVGNVMLYFTDENKIEDILKDVDKLLDQSSLG